jgi:hypothetical protein
MSTYVHRQISNSKSANDARSEDVEGIKREVTEYST